MYLLNSETEVAAFPAFSAGSILYPDYPDPLWKCLADRVGDQLHFVPFPGPAGDKLRTRARKFPELVACCTANWLSPRLQDAP